MRPDCPLVAAPFERFRSYTEAIEGEGLACVQLVAPLRAPAPGTDRCLEELW